MTAKLTIQTEDEIIEYELPVDDSMMLAIELDSALRDNEIIQDDEVLEILDRKQANILDY